MRTANSQDKEGEELPKIEPSSNPNLLGHDSAQKALKDAFGSDRFPHAWLITGPAGIGKATLGYRFARYVLGQSAEKPLFDTDEDLLATDPDSGNFRKVAAGAHPSLRVIQRSHHPKTGKLRTEITVDEVKKAVRLLRTTSAVGGWRVIIVDPVDEMNRNATNALLKTLEEPPPNCLFLLINHAIESGLPTIRSRCRILKLNPISQSEVKTILANLHPDVSEAKLEIVTKLSRGRPGWGARLLRDGKMEMLEACNGLLAGLPQLDIDAALKIADFTAKPGNEDAFTLFGTLIDERIADALKQDGLAQQSANALFEARDQIQSNLSLTQSRNLSKKQVILDTLFQLKSALSATS